MILNFKNDWLFKIVPFSLRWLLHWNTDLPKKLSSLNESVIFKRRHVHNHIFYRRSKIAIYLEFLLFHFLSRYYIWQYELRKSLLEYFNAQEQKYPSFIFWYIWLVSIKNWFNFAWLSTLILLRKYFHLPWKLKILYPMCQYFYKNKINMDTRK